MLKKREQKCTYTWEKKKQKDINHNVNPGDLFGRVVVFLCFLYVFQVFFLHELHVNFRIRNQKAHVLRQYTIFIRQLLQNTSKN